jgi:hypothetical protein
MNFPLYPRIPVHETNILLVLFCLPHNAGSSSKGIAEALASVLTWGRENAISWISRYSPLMTLGNCLRCGEDLMALPQCKLHQSDRQPDLDDATEAAASIGFVCPFHRTKQSSWYVLVAYSVFMEMPLMLLGFTRGMAVMVQ